MAHDKEEHCVKAGHTEKQVGKAAMTAYAATSLQEWAQLGGRKGSSPLPHGTTAGFLSPLPLTPCVTLGKSLPPH